MRSRERNLSTQTRHYVLGIQIQAVKVLYILYFDGIDLDTSGNHPNFMGWVLRYGR